MFTFPIPTNDHIIEQDTATALCHTLISLHTLQANKCHNILYYHIIHTHIMCRRTSIANSTTSVEERVEDIPLLKQSNDDDQRSSTKNPTALQH